MNAFSPDTPRKKKSLFWAAIIAIASFASLPSFASPELPANSDAVVKYPADGANYARFSKEQPPLLPMPQEVSWEQKSFEITSVSSNNLVLQGRDAEQMNFIQQELANFLTENKAEYSQDGKYAITFKLQATRIDRKLDTKWRQAEAYTIHVGENETVIAASSTKGLYYGFKTLQQLIMHRDGKTTIAACTIKDWPDLQVRGFMNDVGRNFMSIDLIKLELEAMSDLKYNVYHFHLTDHHGWRLESKLYPELKDPKNFTRFPGKVYTQEEFVALVEYCRLRNITIIPELDMPGHSCAFRSAMGVSTMKDPKATEALVNLIKELGSLASVQDMPYIHIGTDEVRNQEEFINDEILLAYYDAVKSTGRPAIHWSPGMVADSYKGEGEGKAIEHLWLGCGLKNARPTRGGKYIDSQDSYVNHIDPFECGPAYYYRRPCPYDYAEGLGFILCSWPDVKMSDERNHLIQTPVFPAMAFCSESIWNNPHPKLTVDAREDELLPYFSNLPSPKNAILNALLNGFKKYEDRVLAIRDRFFTDKEFPYVRQSHVTWKLLGPIPHGGDTSKIFPVENILTGEKVAPSYTIDDKEYTWEEQGATGHTVTFRQYCGYPTPFNGGQFGVNANNSTYYALQYIYSPEEQVVPFWISAQNWPSSDRAAGGPPNTPGEWLHTKPKFYVNGKSIEAPEWQGKPVTGVEEPYTNENFYSRTPTPISLKKGWNQVLIKSPCNAAPRRWMFTFAPVQTTTDKLGIGIREFPGLKFATSIPERDRKRH